MNDRQLYLLLQIYNDAISTISWKYQIKLKEGQKLESYTWYKDLVNLYNIIHSLGIKPRAYITFQINNYKQPTKFSRMVPTIRMLTTMKALEDWEKANAAPVKAKILSEDYLIESSKKYMVDLMRANNIDSEEEFFKDPYLISMLSKCFLIKNPIFMSLLNSGYYSKFGLTRESFV